MTTKQMYDEILGRCRYKTDGYYPSNRYDKCRDREASLWNPICVDYAKFFKENDMDFNNTTIFVDSHHYITRDIEVTTAYGEFPKITASAYLSPSNTVNTPRKNCTNNPSKPLSIENVIFSPPVTVVLWSDKTKTIVRCDDNYDSFDPEKGLAMAIAKKLMGDNKGKYYDMFKYWRKRWDEKNETKSKVSTIKTPLNDLSEKIKSAFNIPSHVIIDDLVPPKE